MEKSDFMELALNAIANSECAESFVTDQIKDELDLSSYGQVAMFADHYMSSGEIIWSNSEYGLGSLFNQRDGDVLNVYVAAVKPSQAEAFAKAAKNGRGESCSSTALQQLDGITLFCIDGYYSSWDATDWSNCELELVKPYLRQTVGFYPA